MEIQAIAEFLQDAGYANHVDRRLIPARIILDSIHGVEFSLCINDGDLYLEDLTKVSNRIGFKPITKIALADPDSLDKILEAIHGYFHRSSCPEPDRASGAAGLN